MNKQQLALWFKVVAIILIGFGLLYFFFGLKIFSNVAPLIPSDVLLDWESALYGAIMLGWGVSLFLLGRIAFKRDDRELKRVLLIGLAVWLAFEAAASAWLGVWFNVGVDVAVAALFAVPLLLRRN
jgi:MFS family permease